PRLVQSAVEQRQRLHCAALWIVPIQTKQAGIQIGRRVVGSDLQKEFFRRFGLPALSKLSGEQYFEPEVVSIRLGRLFQPGDELALAIERAQEGDLHFVSFAALRLQAQICVDELQRLGKLLLFLEALGKVIV